MATHALIFEDYYVSDEKVRGWHVDWQSLLQFLAAMIVVVGFFTAVIDRVGDVRNDVSNFKIEMSKEVGAAISTQSRQNAVVVDAMIKSVEYSTSIAPTRADRVRGQQVLTELRADYKKLTSRDMTDVATGTPPARAN